MSNPSPEREPVTLSGKLGAAYFSDDLRRWRDEYLKVRADSRSELACAVLLERYVAGWKCEPGVTFHVPMGSRTIDFLINGVWVEYHPIDLKWAMRGGAFEELCQALHGINRSSQREIRKAIIHDKEIGYWRERRILLDGHGHADDKLITVHSPMEFYRRVLKTLGQCPAKEFTVTREFLKIATRL